MRLAYADPPYLGLGRYYAKHHPDALIWDNLDTHRALIARLVHEYPDGWALSMTSGNLHDLLPLCPRQARVGSWVKPFASFKPGVHPAYAWEPVVFIRTRPADRTEYTARDFLAEPIALRRGLVGAKPIRFCRWVLDLIGYRDGEDTVDDLFPGTGSMADALDRGVLL